MSNPQQKKSYILTELLKTLVVVGIGLLIGMVIVLFVSDEPTKVFDAILTGPLPSSTVLDDGTIRWRGMSRFGTFIEDSVTLALVGLAVAIPFRAMQFSLGADGQLFLGALASAAVSIYLPLPGFILIPLAFIAASLPRSLLSAAATPRQELILACGTPACSDGGPPAGGGGGAGRRGLGGVGSRGAAGWMRTRLPVSPVDVARGPLSHVGRVVTWSCGHVVMWSCSRGHVSWPCGGHVVMCRGHVVT